MSEAGSEQPTQQPQQQEVSGAEKVFNSVFDYVSVCIFFKERFFMGTLMLTGCIFRNTLLYQD